MEFSFPKRVLRYCEFDSKLLACTLHIFVQETERALGRAIGSPQDARGGCPDLSMAKE